MIETVIIIRHGDRLDKEDKNWIYTSPMPWDPPLSAKGFDRVHQLAEELNKTDVTYPVTLYTSPFLRCVQTALAVAEKFDVQMKFCSILGEWMTPEYFPAGAPPDDDHMSIAANSKIELMRNRATKIDFTWDIKTLGKAGEYGETFVEMHERAQRALSAALNGDGTLIIVSHGSLCNSLLAEIRQVPQMEIIGMGEYVVIRR